MRGFRLSVAVAVVSAWSGVAVAQRATGPDSCPQASAIVALADYLLVEPKQPSRFWRDHEASDAAYLKLRYGNLSSAEAKSVLNALAARQRPPERIQELDLAYANTASRAAAIAALPKTESVVPLLRESVLRALIVVDGGDWLIAELVRWRDAAPKGFAESSAFSHIARSVADLGDDQLAALARRAEAAGLWRLAYEFYALRSDFSDLVALLNRMPEQSLGGGAQTPGEKRKHLLGLALSQASFRSPSLKEKQPVEVQTLVGERPHVLMMRPFGPLFAKAPDTVLLVNVFNRTGEKRIATEVAKGLLDDIESGRLDPLAAPDSVLASTVDRLGAVLGAKEAEVELESITGTGASKAYRNDAAAFVQLALARHALTPLVRGETRTAPARPVALSAKFDWDRWLKVAGDIAAGRPLADMDQLIAVDLQGNAGKLGEAIKSLSAWGPREDARSTAHDLMRRLERRCGNLLRPAAPLQETLYRFDAR